MVPVYQLTTTQKLALELACFFETWNGITLYASRVGMFDPATLLAEDIIEWDRRLDFWIPKGLPHGKKAAIISFCLAPEDWNPPLVEIEKLFCRGDSDGVGGLIRDSVFLFPGVICAPLAKRRKVEYELFNGGPWPLGNG